MRLTQLVYMLECIDGDYIDLHRGTITSIFKNICDSYIERLDSPNKTKYAFIYKYVEGYFRCDVSIKGMVYVKRIKSAVMHEVLLELNDFLTNK